MGDQICTRLSDQSSRLAGKNFRLVSRPCPRIYELEITRIEPYRSRIPTINSRDVSTSVESPRRTVFFSAETYSSPILPPPNSRATCKQDELRKARKL